MAIKQRINKWFINFQKYFFTYKDGFFEFSYLANSPKTLIFSLIKMPFNKHLKKDQIITSKSPFMEGLLHYEELEKGLWLISSDLQFKRNVRFKLLYDEFGDSDYFKLNLFVSTNQIKVNDKKLLENKFEIKDGVWFFLKPLSSVLDTHFKGDKGLFLNLNMSKKWMDLNFTNQTQYIESGFDYFINSEDKYVIWNNHFEKGEKLFYEIWDNIRKKGVEDIANKNLLKSQITGFIETFLSIYKEENLYERHFEIKNVDRLRVLKVEHFLTQHLQADFVGITFLSHQFNTSATKLKTEFKLIFGKSILQYFREKQMNLAVEIIQTKKLSIGEIALLFGYENHSKFSSAFKKHIGKFPSEI